jgi:hypothetical protein
MSSLLIVHNGSQFKEQFAEHSTETSHDLPGLRVAMGKQRFDAIFVDAACCAGQLEEMLQAARVADPCVSVVIGATNWSAELRSAAETCEVLMHPGALEVAQCAVRRAMRHTAVMREYRGCQGRKASSDGPPAERDESQSIPVGADLAWVDALPPRLDLRELLGLVEKTVIQRTLAATQGAQAEAARRLGLSRSDLSYKLSKYEMRRPKLAKVQQV